MVRRDWALIAIAFFLAAFGIGAAVLAWQNEQAAEEWRAAHQLAGGERDDALDANEELSDANERLSRTVERLQKRLDGSEEDVKALEARMGQVASEKAQVEDTAQLLVDIAITYDDLASSFQSCVAEQDTFASMALRFDDYFYAGSIHLVEDQLRRVNTACSSAQAQLVNLRQYVDALAG